MKYIIIGLQLYMLGLVFKFLRMKYICKVTVCKNPVR